MGKKYAKVDKEIEERKWGKVKKEEEREFEIFNRKLIVWVREFESGLQRCGVFFADKNREFLIKQNMDLRKKIQELEAKLEEKDK